MPKRAMRFRIMSPKFVYTFAAERWFCTVTFTRTFLRVTFLRRFFTTVLSTVLTVGLECAPSAGQADC
jgi:hypothetical protein